MIMSDASSTILCLARVVGASVFAHSEDGAYTTAASLATQPLVKGARVCDMYAQLKYANHQWTVNRYGAGNVKLATQPITETEIVELLWSFVEYKQANKLNSDSKYRMGDAQSRQLPIHMLPEAVKGRVYICEPYGPAIVGHVDFACTGTEWNYVTDMFGLFFSAYHGFYHRYRNWGFMNLETGRYEASGSFGFQRDLRGKLEARRRTDPQTFKPAYATGHTTGSLDKVVFEVLASIEAGSPGDFCQYTHAQQVFRHEPDSTKPFWHSFCRSPVRSRISAQTHDNAWVKA